MYRFHSLICEERNHFLSYSMNEGKSSIESDYISTNDEVSYGLPSYVQVFTSILKHHQFPVMALYTRIDDKHAEADVEFEIQNSSIDSFQNYAEAFDRKNQSLNHRDVKEIPKQMATNVKREEEREIKNQEKDKFKGIFEGPKESQDERKDLRKIKEDDFGREVGEKGEREERKIKKEKEERKRKEEIQSQFERDRREQENEIREKEKEEQEKARIEKENKAKMEAEKQKEEDEKRKKRLNYYNKHLHKNEDHEHPPSNQDSDAPNKQGSKLKTIDPGEKGNDELLNSLESGSEHKVKLEKKMSLCLECMRRVSPEKSMLYCETCLKEKQQKENKLQSQNQKHKDQDIDKPQQNKYKPNIKNDQDEDDFLKRDLEALQDNAEIDPEFWTCPGCYTQNRRFAFECKICLHKKE